MAMVYIQSKFKEYIAKCIIQDSTRSALQIKEHIYFIFFFPFAGDMTKIEDILSTFFPDIYFGARKHSDLGAIIIRRNDKYRSSL